MIELRLGRQISDEFFGVSAPVSYRRCLQHVLTDSGAAESGIRSLGPASQFTEFQHHDSYLYCLPRSRTRTVSRYVLGYPAVRREEGVREADSDTAQSKLDPVDPLIGQPPSGAGQ
jgi:hypothetical protein